MINKNYICKKEYLDMKTFSFLFIFCLSILSVQAQNTTQLRSNEKQITAQATGNTFNRLIQNKQYKEAVNEGIKLSQSYTANVKYKEAFAICRAMDESILQDEVENNKPNYELRYLVNKERLRMYTNIKKWDQSKNYLAILNDYATKLKSEAIKEDLLFTEASVYHSYGLVEKSIEAYKKIVNLRSKGKEGLAIGDTYKQMIDYARQNNNAPLAIAMKKLYTAWQDSINKVQTTVELNTLKEKYDTTQISLKDKEGTIKTNIFIIISLCVLCAVLAVAVLFLLGLLFKNVSKYKKLNTSLAIANENNNQKSHFISNISAQIDPTLDRISEKIALYPSTDVVKSSVEALKNLTKDIHSFISLEETKDEKYPQQDLNINSLCERIMEEAKVNFKPNVEAVLNVPRVTIHTNPEALEKILSHLLMNAAIYTESGKITLEFKKRSAHSGQFMVTDTGCGIDKDRYDSIFKPFTQVHDIIEGSGLGLPSCSIIAFKLNGNIRIDEDYKKGTRFILELHS